MGKKIDLSLIIACYNEEPHLESNFKKINWVLKNLKISYEVIFIEDCSRDKTKSVIKRIMKNFEDIQIETIFHDKNVGRGGSVSEGIMMAHGDVVGFIDVDLEVSEQYIPEFYWNIKEEYDVAIGRRLYEFTLAKLVRYIGSKTYVFLVKTILKSPFADTEAGYKFFNRREILPVLNKTKDKKWFWDTEIVMRSYIAGLKIIEIPVAFTRNSQKKSTVNVIPDSVNYFLKLLEFRKNI